MKDSLEPEAGRTTCQVRELSHDASELHTLASNSEHVITAIALLPIAMASEAESFSSVHEQHVKRRLI